MAIVNEHNIARASFFLIVVVISLIIFAAGAYFIVTKHEISEGELGRLETQMIEWQKRDLQSDVAGLRLRIESLNREIQEQDSTAFTSDPVDAEDSAADPVDATADEEGGDPFQQRILDRLGWAEDLADATFFIYQLHDMSGGDNFATMLFNPSRPDLEGQSLSTDFPDARGHDFRKVFMKDIRDRGESFVIYYYSRQNPAEPGKKELGRKLAYFTYDPSWNWILAKSAYLDSIDQFMQDRRGQLKKSLVIDLAVLGIIFLVSVVLAFFLAYSFSFSIHALLKKYRDAEQLHLLEIENLSKTVEQQNRRDRLTSAYNRAHFSDELSKERERSERYHTPLSMILFDIDHFRAINDKVGSSAGDTILQEVVGLVQDNIRKSDVFARWAGEEFAILAPGINLEQGMKLADKIRAVIEAYRFTANQAVTCSFGVGFYQRNEDLETFVQRVDTALRQAKSQGRNRCVALR